MTPVALIEFACSIRIAFFTLSLWLCRDQRRRLQLSFHSNSADEENTRSRERFLQQRRVTNFATLNQPQDQAYLEN